MKLRQIEIVVPEEHSEACDKLLADDSVIHYWEVHSENSGHLIKVILKATNTEQFLDQAEQLFGNKEGFRLVMVSVEATLPRIEDDSDEDAKAESDESKKEVIQGLRISREELYSDVSDASELTRIYMALVILSTVVAALGVLRDNTAVVVGAMVIAPLLGPNVGLALSSTLADFKLGINSVKSNLTGLGAALLISIILGATMTVDTELNHIASRTEVHLSDIALALASGAAGVLAYTVGMSAAVIGVMVAVALLPPLVVAGLLVGDMQFDLALYAFLLTFTNVICVNLAGIATFILQGVRPRTWYKAKKAKRINRIALTLWISLVLLLAVLIYFA